eukprot:TRINITY_DN67138_c10_g3_i1.p1 TRINITY_DN67138_c10_g3~~TRINITY_DN67138_c10_g3_i1.p1  ORF type:complete len:500 (-),score=61.36 TRINITY_DN67138_c10_g3_i1:1073-2572(-)
MGFDMGKVKSVKGIVLIVCFVLAIIGMLFIWISNKTGEAEDWCAIFSFIIVLLNCLTFFIELDSVGPVAGVMELAMIDFHFSTPHFHDHVHNDVLPILGYVFMIIATLLSFIAFPVQVGKPKIDAKSKSGIITIVMIVAAVLLIIGNMFLWFDHGDTHGGGGAGVGAGGSFSLIRMQPTFLAVMFIAGNLWGLEPAINLAFYASGLLLHGYWALMVGSDGLTTLGAILIVVALFCIIILTIMQSAASDGSGSLDSVKGKFVSKDIVAIVLLVLWILAFVGCILVWAGTASKVEDWCVFFSLAIVTLNCVIYFLEKGSLATISGCLGYGIWNSLSFVDLLFTWAHFHDRANGSGSVIAGYALQIVAVVGSYIVFKGTVSIGKPNFGDKMNIAVVVLAVLLIIGNVFVWIGTDCGDSVGGNCNIYVSPCLLAILYLMSSLWGLEAGVELCFFIPAYIIHAWWTNMVVWSGIEVVGAILINAALIAMIVIHVIRMKAGGGSK